MNIQCSICHESVRVPVRLTCFPCDVKPGQPSCNSITRVCLCCAREYLQLNKKRGDRIAIRKCLTCPATVQCAHLSSYNSYEKDFLIMSLDTRDDYQCPHECSFQGTQNNLNHHLHSECPRRIVFCKLCRAVYPAEDENAHAAVCPERFCCVKCNEHIPIYEQKAHYQDMHDMQKCRFCHELVESNGFSAHYEACPERPRDCPQCGRPVARCQLYDHMVAHIEGFQKIITQNNKTNTELLQSITLLLSECQKHCSRP